MSTPNRPAGAKCVRCKVKPARLNGRYPHLATFWCGDQCQGAWERAREYDEMATTACSIRRLLGVPGNKGPAFTLPEMRLMLKRLQRVLPYELMTSTRHRRNNPVVHNEPASR